MPSRACAPASRSRATAGGSRSALSSRSPSAAPCERCARLRPRWSGTCSRAPARPRSRCTMASSRRLSWSARMPAARRSWHGRWMRRRTSYASIRQESTQLLRTIPRSSSLHSHREACGARTSDRAARSPGHGRVLGRARACRCGHRQRAADGHDDHDDHDDDHDHHDGASARADVPSGVTIGSVDVGDLLPYQAASVVRAAFERPLILVVTPTRQYRVKPSKLGATPLVKKAVARARFARPGASIPLDVMVKRAKVRSYLDRVGKKLARPAVDARLVLRGAAVRVVRREGGPPAAPRREHAHDPHRARDQPPRADQARARRREAEGDGDGASVPRS